MTSRKVAARAKWDDCQIIATKMSEVLGVGSVTKQQVHDHLYSAIKREGLLDRCKAGDADAIRAVTETVEWERVS